MSIFSHVKFLWLINFCKLFHLRIKNLFSKYSEIKTISLNDVDKLEEKDNAVCSTKLHLKTLEWSEKFLQTVRDITKTDQELIDKMKNAKKDYEYTKGEKYRNRKKYEALYIAHGMCDELNETINRAILRREIL